MNKMLKYDSIKRQKKSRKRICDLLNLQEANTKTENPLKK